MTEEGCKRGDKCKFVHTVLDPKDGRCFQCSGVGHGKKDCPHQQKKRVDEVQSDRSTRKPGIEGSKGSGKDKQTSNGGAENVENAESSKPSGESPGVQSKGGSKGGQKGSSKGSSDTPQDGFQELIQEAASLMKSLRPSLKVIKPKEQLCKVASDNFPTGLLDGGATNALRMGTEEELKNSLVVTVELASGTNGYVVDWGTN